MLESGTVPAVYTLDLPKRGNTAAEYEDAFAKNVARGRFAIADGASQSMFSALWAQLLVGAFVDAPGPQPAPWNEWLPPLQETWRSKTSGGPLPWYAEAKLQEGAFATFLGLVVEPQRCCCRCFRAVAVGDGCLFQIRVGELFDAFPMTRSRDFSASPFLVGSRPLADARLAERSANLQGDWRAGDQFWLMTDALGQWFLREYEQGNRPWEALLPFLTAPARHQEFAGWIDNLRDREELRNDDVTVAAICL